MDGYLQLTLGAAFLAGLSGGAHCAAMCGPLIGIACGPRGQGGGRLWLRQALAYNAGRISSYVAAGAISGFAGAAGLALRGTPGAQQSLMLAMSASMILLAAYVAGILPLGALERAGAAAWRRFSPAVRWFLPVNTAARAFGAGVVLGWVPCAMVYVALVAALATADPARGALVMAAFGLGTLPNVLAISAWFRHVLAAARSRAARLLVAAIMAVVGALGLLKAAHPATAALAAACLDVPGIGAIFGGH